MKRRLLIVDDEPSIRFAVRSFFQDAYEVVEADTVERARETFRSQRPDAIVADFKLPDGTALDLLAEFAQGDTPVPTVVLTAHGSIDLAVQAIKLGADQFLTKPVELPTLKIVLERMLETQRVRRQLVAHKKRAGADADPFDSESPLMRELELNARAALDADATVLIGGETGTGKGVLARWMHEHGRRSAEAFVDLNCAGLTRDLLETELFGHEKGAFTGAAQAKTGLLEVAHRGTVFLDEIGDIDPVIQPKLLKVLEEKRFRRLGDVRDRQVDVRLIAASHQNLPELIRQGKFRADLYYRINTIRLDLPPLRARREDIVPLARRMLASLAAQMGRQAPKLQPSAEAALAAYPWPGNLRELRNVLERALLRGHEALAGEHFRFESLDALPAAADEAGDAALTLEEIEIRHLRRVLKAMNGKVEPAAASLGVSRSTLYEKIKKYGL